MSYAIAIAKTALIIWLFMEMKTRDGLQRIALGVGFAWLFILLLLSFADILTRGWLGA